MTISGSLPECDADFDWDCDNNWNVVYFNFYTSDGKLVSFTGSANETSDGDGQVVYFTSSAVPNSSGEFILRLDFLLLYFLKVIMSVKANYGGTY